jgi:hypothetical protein
MSNLINFKNSIFTTGGASYNLVTGEFNPNHGYMVSLSGSEKIIKYDQSIDLEREVINYVRQYVDIILGGETISDSNFLGAWISDDFNLYLDVSVLVDDFSDADKLARANNQLAFYDNKNKVSINVIKK